MILWLKMRNCSLREAAIKAAKIQENYYAEQPLAATLNP